jgi:hypothetical protein
MPPTKLDEAYRKELAQLGYPAPTPPGPNTAEFWQKSFDELCGRERPLGYDINRQVPNGTPAEIAASRLRKPK